MEIYSKLKVIEEVKKLNPFELYAIKKIMNSKGLDKDFAKMFTKTKKNKTILGKIKSTISSYKENYKDYKELKELKELADEFKIDFRAIYGNSSKDEESDIR